MGSLHTVLHVRVTICEFTELVHHHGILYSISSDQGIHFKQMKCSNGFMIMEFTSFTMFPNILQQLALTEQWNSLKGSITVPIK